MSEKPLVSKKSPKLNPAEERLVSKFSDLEETLEVIEAQGPTEDKKHIVTICRTYLKQAKNFLDAPSLSLRFPPFGSRHPHLVWELLHRVDEYLILLIKKEELPSTAIDIQNSFDLNIKDEKTRARWIGDKGKLNQVIHNIENGEDKIEDRYALKDAQKLVNEQMDRTFWQLSANTLTSVWSGALLAIIILVAWLYPHSDNTLVSLDKGGLSKHFLTLFVLGLMGAYLSNLMTREDFLYVRGGPFWRYFFHNLFSKPVMSGFAAIFIYLLARSELIFAIGSGNTSASNIIKLNVSANGIGYTYAFLAIISGFAADKILKNMIDSVLKKLEQKAEKSKETGAT
jgi:hypothetical protein